MKILRVLLLCAVLGIPVPALVQAGECRAQLHPLLLQTSPDPAGLRAVQALCAAESSAGDADATYQLALLHLGLVDWAPDAAIPQIQTAARHGVAEAQYWLAWQYDAGPLLPHDAGLALRWYEAAGENEHRLALDRLADAYRDGDLGLTANARKSAALRARAERCRNRSG